MKVQTLLSIAALSLSSLAMAGESHYQQLQAQQAIAASAEQPQTAAQDSAHANTLDQTDTWQAPVHTSR